MKLKIDKQYRSNLMAAAILVAFILVVIAIGLCLPKEKELLQGQVELTDYRISSELPERVVKFYVQEGDLVHKGDTLVIMQAADIGAKLAQAEAAHSAAQAMEDEANNGARKQQIQAAYEIWQKSIAGVDIAQKTFKRVSKLFENGVISAQKRDEAQAQYDAAKATEKAAKAQYDMAVEGARVEDKEAARAQVSRANGAIAEVNSYVKETVLTAVTDGRVTEIFPEIGELVGTGAPIMNVDVTNDAWFTFNIREDKLSNIHIGEQMHVFVPAMNKSYPVRISLMKNVGNFAAWKATKTLGQYDLKMFEVQARPLSPISNLEPGMSAILNK